MNPQEQTTEENLDDRRIFSGTQARPFIIGAAATAAAVGLAAAGYAWKRRRGASARLSSASGDQNVLSQSKPVPNAHGGSSALPLEGIAQADTGSDDLQLSEGIGGSSANFTGSHDDVGALGSDSALTTPEGGTGIAADDVGVSGRADWEGVALATVAPDRSQADVPNADDSIPAPRIDVSSGFDQDSRFSEDEDAREKEDVPRIMRD